MRKPFLFCIVILSAGEGSFSQNGLTGYNLPSGYTPTQLQHKNAFAIDNAGNKWIGFRDIGLGKYDGTNWTVYNTQNSQIPSDQISSISIDAANTIWVGTKLKGVARFDGTSWTTYDTTNSSIISSKINAVSVNGNDVWIGTDKGTSKFNGSTFTNYTTINSVLTDNFVQCFSFETNGNVYIGTKNGLTLFNGSNGVIYNISNSGLTSNNISCLYNDGNAIWVGTRLGGTYRLLNNVIENVNTIFPTGAIIYPLSPTSICKGPNGGITFNGSNYIIEITNKPIIYYLSASAFYMACENSSGLLWFVNQYFQASSDKLYFFDPKNYNGFGLGWNPNNLKYLDINQVSAAMLNRGDMHWNPGNSSHGEYEVPKGSGIRSIYASAFWMGGYDGSDSLHLAGQEYVNAGDDFWPGPLDTINGTIDTVTAARYDKIWKVDRYKIEEFKYYFALGMVQSGQYFPDNDILAWPAHGIGNYSRNLAPFVDVNSNGIYDPINGGDYPKIKGDQMLYWIFNDNLTKHGQTGGAPLKIEVHASAYAFTCPNIPDSMKALNYTTLYNYKIFNRSTLKYDSVYVGNWQDSDLGCATDDRVGCYPEGNYDYYYNGDSVDVSCSGELGYGSNPPILSKLVLNGPPANPNDGIDNNNDGTIDEPGEKNLMTHFFYFYGGAPPSVGDPSNAKEYYNYLSGSWAGGNHLLYGGSGYGTGVGATNTPTNFCFPNFPYDTSGWSEITAQYTPGDTRSLSSCGPFTLNAGASVDFDWAIVWSRDTTLPFMSKAFFDKNLHDNQKIQEWFAKDSFPSCLKLNVGVNETTQPENMLSIFPNPSSDFISVNYKVITSHAQFEIIDVLGRTLIISHYPSTINQIDISKLSPGVYLLKVSDGDLHFAKRFVRQ